MNLFSDIMSCRTTVLLLLSALLPAIAPAQAVRITEKEIQNQATFLDAYGKKTMGKVDSAKAMFMQLLESDLTNDAACFELADIFRTDGNLDQAMVYMRKAIELSPQNKWYQLFLAELYEASGKDSEAAAIYEQQAATQAFDQDIYFKWAYFLLRAEEPAKALKVYDVLEKKIGINDEIIRHKHTVFLALGDSKKAERELVRLVDAFPDRVEYYHLLAGFYEQQQNKEQALLVYQKILTINPNDPQAVLALANTRKQGNEEGNYFNALRPVFQNPAIPIDDKIKEILPYLEKVATSGDLVLGQQLIELALIVRQVHPNDAKGYALCGDLYYHTGDKTSALDQYQAALKLNKNIYAVWEQVMYIQRESGSYTDLLRTTEEVVERFPNQPSVHFLQGVANNQLQRYDAAVESLKQALMMSSKEPLMKLEILLELANAAYAQADYTEAKTWIEKALEASQNNHPPALVFYGDVLFRLGDETNALKYWQMARDKGDKSPELLKKISEKKL